MLFDVTFVLMLTYVLLMLLFILGLFRAKYRPAKGFEPTVSIVVAARNEETRLPRFLESLRTLDYPAEKLEVILVDDQSTDCTYDIMKSFAKENRYAIAVKAPQETNHLRGKVNAVAYGISQSKGEIIFFTDADCVVPKTWLRATVAQYNERVGLVAGYTLLETGNWFEGMQSLDWAFIHTLAAGGIGAGLPFSCAGNNLSFRRKAYDEVGGFHNIPFCITEDLALFKAIRTKTNWGYRYLLSAENLVMSLPCSSFREVLRQKQRWGVGGIDLKLRGYLMITLGVSLSLLLFANFFFTPSTPALLILWLPKLAVDFLLLAIPLARLRLLSLLKYFPIFEAYLLVYVPLVPFIVFLGPKVVWKGRQFDRSATSEEAKSPADIVDEAF